ncbi:helix-turn-helix transcriptional regulator [Pseudomonas syringae group genomosp. 7]|uniref:helix-turn-helix transcriptional regulator n=2 Tax=Pseudomonas syringae group genomosp. 7 TaxID=251699 RepID=UPI001F4C0989|nr:hypothetical protein [Pseudomonas syringae group genomosp. 7]UNB61770.1 hypothetical protein MME54_19300 [Pseudomonas syringae pv. helianthi]
MSVYEYADYSFTEVEAVATFHKMTGVDLDIMNYPRGKFLYRQEICSFDNSFVCSSSSLTERNYGLKNELDGFLVTCPQTGSLTWKTISSTYKANPSTLAIYDQREVLTTTFSEGIRSKTLLIDNSEILKYLTLILGHEPKARIRFHNSKVETWEIQHFINLISMFLTYVRNSKISPKSVADSLMESLVGFLLHNVSNSYTSIITETEKYQKTTPYDIKHAAEFMESNTNPDLTIGDVATFAGISVRSLQVGFKRYKNMTLNRPWFPRHSPSSGNNVSHTLLETAA